MAAIDERVVQMQFNNAQFEKGAKQSIETIEKLNKSLDFSDAGKGLQKFSIQFDAFTSAANAAVDRLTNSVMDFGQSLIKSFTTDPIKSGLEEYETQINATQTILANTQKEGATINDVNKALNELNHYADMTIYNFTEMTRNIGTFTAAGVKLDTSVQAIKGIANLAAVSGSTSQQASTAMYQLSQALAAGTVKLQDWNSVVNAGMGGQVFQDALMETARVHGIAIDSMVKKEGSFRETLSKGWLTSQILTETLAKFTGDLSREELKAIGYTEQQIDAIVKMGETANDAATKVKTFSQLLDTLKEAAQSGWTQTWQTIIGDFEEAKELWTGVSDVLSDAINKSAEARNAMLQVWKNLGGREAMLYGIKEALQAVNSMLDPIKQGLRDIFPAKQAGVAGAHLFDLTKKFAEFFDGLRLSEQRADQYRRIFRGLASVLDIVLTVVKQVIVAFAGPLVNVLGVAINITIELAACLGDAVYALRNFVKESNIVGAAARAISIAFGVIFESLKMLWNSDLIQGFVRISIAAFDALDRAITPVFDKIAFAIEQFINRIKGMQKLDFKELYSAISELVSSVFTAITSFKLDLSGAMDALGAAFNWVKIQIKSFSSWITDNTGAIRFDRIFGIVYAGAVIAALLAIRRAFYALADVLSPLADIGEAVAGMFENIGGVLKAWQNELNSKAFINIAKGIAILAASLAVLTLVDTRKLFEAAVVLTALTAAILGLSKLMSGVSMTKFSINFAALASGIAIFSAALLILITALVKLDEVNLDGLAGKMLALTALSGIMAAAAVIISKNAPKLSSGSIFLLSFAGSMKILVGALKSLSDADITLSGKTIMSLVAMVGMLTILAKACQTTSRIVRSGGSSSSIKNGIDAFGLLGIVASLHLLISALKKLGKMDLGDIRNGLTAMIPIMGLFAALMIASKAAGQYADKAGKAMLAISSAMIIMSFAIKSFAKISPADLKSAESAISEILIIFGGITLVSKFAGQYVAKAGVAILAMSAAIALLVAPIMVLSAMSTEELDRAIGAITKLELMFALIVASTYFSKDAAGTIKSMGISLTLLVAAMAVLALLDPEGMARATMAIDSLMVCMALLVASTKLVSKAKKVIPAIIAITAAVAAVAGIMAALSLVPADGMLERATAISEILAVMAGALTILGKTKAKLSKEAKASIGVMTAIVAGLAVIIGVMSQFDMSQALSSATALSEVLLAMSTAMLIFSKALLIPINVANAVQLIGAFGVLVAVVTAMTAVAGIIAQNQGVLGTMEAGVQLLGKCGEAIGNFIGGILGGVIGGAISAVSDSLPILGTNLSSFMENMKPFFAGAKEIDGDSVTGVLHLAEAVLAITAAQVLNGITSFITGGNPLSKFAEELAEFGPKFRDFANSMGQIDNTDAMLNAVEAARVVAEFARIVPNSGGVLGAIVGNNDLSKFGEELAAFAPGFATYARIISAANVDSDILNATSAIVKSIAEYANEIPNKGGLLAAIVGDNTLGAFGEELAAFAPGFATYATIISNANVDEKILKATTVIISAIAQMANEIPNSGGVLAVFFGENDMSKFGEDLETFGYAFVRFSNTMAAVNIENLNKTLPAMEALVALAQTIPQTGGLFDIFGGTSDIGKFGDKLEKFGLGIASYSVAIATVSTEKMNQVTAELRNVLALIKDLEAVDQSKLGKLPGLLQKIANDSTAYFVDTFNNAKSEAETAGNNLVRGVESGVTNRIPSLKEKAKEAANGYLNAFRSAAGIHSPSTEQEKDGRDLNAGVEQGVIATAPTLFQRARDTANGYIKAFRDTLQTHGLYSGQTFGDGVKSVLGLERGVENESENGGLSGVLENFRKKLIAPVEDVVKSAMPQGSAMVDNIAKGISSNKSAEKAAKSKAESIKAEFEKTLSSLDLNLTTYDLEYQLWGAANERTASDAQKSTQQMDNVSKKMQTQAEKVDIAQKIYEKTLAAYGETATETQQAYNDFLKEQTSFYQLSNELANLQEESAKSAKESAQASRDAYNQFMRYDAGKLLEQGFSIKEIQQYASKISGYNIPSAIQENQEGANQQIVNANQSMQRTWLNQAEQTNQTVVPAYGKIGENSAIAMGEGINKNGDKPVGETKKVGAACESVIQKQAPIWQTGGKTMASSLAAGITANSSVVLSAVNTITKGTFSALMTTLTGLSKKGAVGSAMKSAGSNMAKGMAGGFLADDYAIFDATGKISENMLNEALRYADSINAAVSGKLSDFEPAIRPVIDMTDVEGSIKKIDEYISKATTASQALGSGRISQDINVMGYLGTKTRREDTMASLGGGGYGSGDITINMTQNNTSPSSLNSSAIYRATNSFATGVVNMVSSIIHSGGSGGGGSGSSRGSNSSKSSGVSSGTSGRVSQDIRSDGTIGVKR